MFLLCTILWCVFLCVYGFFFFKVWKTAKVSPILYDVCPWKLKGFYRNSFWMMLWFLGHCGVWSWECGCSVSSCGPNCFENKFWVPMFFNANLFPVNHSHGVGQNKQKCSVIHMWQNVGEVSMRFLWAECGNFLSFKYCICLVCSAPS